MSFYSITYNITFKLMQGGEPCSIDGEKMVDLME